MSFKSNRGFTLVELLVVAFILLIGICGILSLFANTMTYTQSAWDLTTATSHAEYLLEEMQSRTTLGELEDIDWNSWAQKQNMNTLPQETFTVTFPNPGSNPLDIEVLDQWQRNSRNSNVVLKTKLIK
jgi:prepilin-type N-terminal cleavage/methylation domain-containing protein